MLRPEIMAKFQRAAHEQHQQWADQRHLSSGDTTSVGQEAAEYHVIK
jgi:hypothetical protein